MSRLCCYISSKMLSVTCGSYRIGSVVEKHLQKVNFPCRSHVRDQSDFRRQGSRECVQKYVRYVHREIDKLPTDATVGVDDESYDTGFSIRNFYFSTPEEEKRRSVVLRNQLYENSKDPITSHLKECSSEEQVFKLLDEKYSVLNAEHVSQAILVLRDIETSNEILNTNIQNHSSFLRSKYSKANNHSSNFQGNLTDDSDFSRLLAKITELVDEFSVDALASTVLYLQKMGLSLSNPILASLMEELEKQIDALNCDQLPASVLSKYSTVIRVHYEHWSSLYLGHLAESKAKELIELSTNLADLKNICIFYHNCSPLITDSIMANIKAKIITLLDDIESTDPSNVLRIMYFLQQIPWREKNYDLTLLMLKQSTEKDVCFSLRHLLNLVEIFPGNCEPYSLIVLLNKHNSVLEGLKDSQNKLAVCFLQSVASNYSIKCQHDLQKELTQSLSRPPLGEDTKFDLNDLYIMFKQLRTLDRKVFLSYWSRVSKNIESEPDQGRTIPRLAFIFNRYLMFNSSHFNVRHHNFELKMCAWLLQDLKIAVEKYYPSYFSRTVAFLLAYGQFRNFQHLDALIEKLHSVIHQLQITDWFTISVGLFTAMELRRKQSLSPEFLQQFVQLSSSLNKAALNYLEKNPSISARDLGYLARSYYYRHGVVDSDLFSEIIARYRTMSVENSTPQAVVNSLKYFLKMDYFVPEFLETAAECVIKHNNDLKANVAATVLYSCFHFGYIPHCAEAFFTVLHELLSRDKQNLHCLHLIRAAISLAYFYQLPQSLIQSLFNIDFLDKVNQEIKLSSVKVFYPMKARNLLMELNRTVCLDYPEQDIPWFHNRYCEDISAIDSTRTTSFHEDVDDVLVYLLGDKKLFLKNVTSPYFYKLDFEIFLDQNGAPVDAKLVKNPAAYSRVAVVLLHRKDISHPSEQLKGFAQLRQRHLEIMGYRVVSISPVLWNTMFMTEKCCKADYLRQQIWPNHKIS